MHRSHASMYIHVYIIYISIYHAYPSMSILFFYFSYRQRRSKGQCYGSASQLYPSMSTKTSLNDSSAVCSATTYRSSSYLTMYMARERGRGRRLVIIGLTIGCESPSSQIDLTPREDGLQEEAQPSLSMPVARQRRYGRKYLGEKPVLNEPVQVLFYYLWFLLFLFLFGVLNLACFRFREPTSISCQRSTLRR